MACSQGDGSPGSFYQELLNGWRGGYDLPDRESLLGRSDSNNSYGHGEATTTCRVEKDCQVVVILTNFRTYKRRLRPIR